MKTPTIEEVKEYFKNAKEVKCLFDGQIFDISESEIVSDKEDYFEVINGKVHTYCRLYKSGKYAEIISYIEPTTKVRNSVLLQLADNNSFSEELIRKEFPQLFDNKLEVGKWYKSRANRLVYRTGNYNNYGFCRGMIWKNDLMCYEPKNWELATPQEVETAFKDLFIKMGFIKGKVFKCLDTNLEITIKNSNLDFDHFETGNIIYIDDYQVFKNGKLATIIETPTDIITIVEKYGKDKVISLIEKM